MTIDTLSAQIFIAVAETQSFTKAAQRVSRTQSAVSQQIAKLENFFNREFFKRGKNLILTADGEKFLSHARQIYKLHCQTIDYFKEPDLGGEVRFGIPEDFASIFLYDILSQFTSAHPLIAMHIECDLTINLYNSFAKKDLDLAIVKTNRKNEFKNAQILSSQKMLWIGDKKLIKKHGAIPLIVSPKPCVYREEMISALEKNKIDYNIVFSSHNYAGKIAAIKAGIGIAAMPQKIIPHEVEIIKSNFLPKLKDSHIYMLKQNNVNGAVNSFAEFIEKNLN